MDVDVDVFRVDVEVDEIRQTPLLLPQLPLLLPQLLHPQQPIPPATPIPAVPTRARRLRNVTHYHKLLKSEKFNTLCDLSEPLLAFPILFKDQQQANLAYDLLMTAGFFIRRWYSPLLFPGPASNHIYHYNPKSAPIAENISPRVLCLPTDIKEADCKRLIKLLSDPKNIS